MARVIIVAGICAFFVATTLSFPSIESGKPVIKEHPEKAMIAMSEDGQPEFVVVGEEMGRAGNLQTLFNFTAFLEGRPPNQTAINFVPLITILASGLQGNGR